MGNMKGSRHRTYSLVRVEMLVRYKPEVPDPARASILANLREQGYEQVTSVVVAKFFQMKFVDSTLRKSRSDAVAFGRKLLANSVTERFEILKVEAVKAA